MLRHFFIILIYSAILLVSEITHRYVFNIPPLARIAESFAILFFVISAFYFAKYRITRIFIGVFFGLSTILQNIHYDVYQGWMTNSHYLLMFTEVTEITRTGVTMLHKILPTFFWGCVEVLIFLSITRFKRKTHIAADIIFFVFLAYMSVRSFRSDNDMGLTPRVAYSRIKANNYAFSSFIGRILPYEMFDLSDTPEYSMPTPKIISEPKIKNVILVVGESFSAKNAQVFGYHRNTTPFLSQIVTNTDAYLKPAYAAGLATAISLPALFNSIPYPNGTKQVSLGHTNLLKLAKLQGFSTYFHSSQPEWEMEIINMLGGAWADTITYPTNLGYSVYSSMNDHKLLPYLYDINLDNGKNFVVLHQRGSHGPYAGDLSENEKVFNSGSALDNYDSTIHHTDQLLQKVFEHLTQRGKDDWVMIYTSDHGQYVTDKVYNQGTINEENYLVPLFIYTQNKMLSNVVKENFANCEKAFHQQVSTFIINTLGFDMPISNCSEGVINAHLLSGNSGYLKVKNNQVEFFDPKSGNTIPK